MHAIDVLHVAAALTVAMFALRAVQAVAEHYWPESEGVAAMRYLYGGP